MHSKTNTAQTILSLGSSLFVHIDPTVEGVQVPAWLYGREQVVLQFGKNLPVPIKDLIVDSDGICGTLSFKGVPFFCDIPWDSVFALVADNGRGNVWAEDMPEAIKAQVEQENLRNQAGPRQGNVTPIGHAKRRRPIVPVHGPKRNHLKLVN